MPVVSNSRDNKSFSTILIAKAGALNNIDDYESWNIFLRDHRAYLRANSDTVLLDEISLKQKSYRINSLLQEHNGASKDTLPFIVANDFHSVKDLNPKHRVFYIPRASTVNELRKQYYTCRTLQSS